MITFQLLVRLTDIEFWPSQRIRSLTLFSTEESKWHLTARSETMCRCSFACLAVFFLSFFGFSVKWIYLSMCHMGRNYLTLSSTSCARATEREYILTWETKQWSKRRQHLNKLKSAITASMSFDFCGGEVCFADDIENKFRKSIITINCVGLKLSYLLRLKGACDSAAHCLWGVN